MFVLIENIPLGFRTPDLRNFFAYSIENEFLACFNYRHRPHATGKFNICICQVKACRFDDFVKLYDKKNWIDSAGNVLKSKCSLSKVKSNQSTDSNANTIGNLNELLEFNKIPSWMPQG